MKKFIALFLLFNCLALTGQNLKIDNLLGKWFLVGYLDSIVVNKQIYKYSIHNPSPSFAQVDFKEPLNKIELQGYYESASKFDFIEKVDERYYYGYNGKKQFELTFEILNNDTVLKLYSLGQKKLYLYKRQSYNFDISTDHVRNYLTKNLFEGTYLCDSKKIVLNENGAILGLPGYSKYRILVNPYEESFSFDQLVLINNNNKQVRFAWKWIGNILIFYNLEREIEGDSGFYIYKVTNEYLRLEKK